MVEILRCPTEDDWWRCKLLAISTSGMKHALTANTEWRKKILRCEHSPIRTLMFTIRMDVPYYVSVHFCRHKYGVEHYVGSQRNDRQDKYDRLTAPQAAMVTHVMDCNAQSLMQMARKRLCGKADPATRKAMQEIVDAVVKVAPEFEEFLVPQCKYFHECKEFQPCGRTQNLSSPVLSGVSTDVAQSASRETVTIVQNGERVKVYKDEIEKELKKQLGVNLCNDISY